MSDRPDTIVLIHGLWMTPRSWEGWIEHYRGRGFEVIAPAWPGMEGEVEALNADPTPIAGLEIDTIVDHYEQIIRALPKPPIIVGHSFGGAFTQVLLDRGLGAAGIGIASATVKGVLDLPLSTIRATSPVLRNPFGDHKAVPLNEKQFHYAFANTLPPGRSRTSCSGATTCRRRARCCARARSRTSAATRRRRSASSAAARRCCSSRSARTTSSRRRPATTTWRSTRTRTRSSPSRSTRAGPHFPGVAGWEEIADFALAWALDPVELDTREGVRA